MTFELSSCLDVVVAIPLLCDLLRGTETNHVSGSAQYDLDGCWKLLNFLEAREGVESLTEEQEMKSLPSDLCRCERRGKLSPTALYSG